MENNKLYKHSNILAEMLIEDETYRISDIKLALLLQLDKVLLGNVAV